MMYVMIRVFSKYYCCGYCTHTYLCIESRKYNMHYSESLQYPYRPWGRCRRYAYLFTDHCVVREVLATRSKKILRKYHSYICRTSFIFTMPALLIVDQIELDVSTGR